MAVANSKMKMEIFDHEHQSCVFKTKNSKPGIFAEEPMATYPANRGDFPADYSRRSGSSFGGGVDLVNRTRSPSPTSTTSSSPPSLLSWEAMGMSAPLSKQSDFGERRRSPPKPTLLPKEVLEGAATAARGSYERASAGQEERKTSDNKTSYVAGVDNTPIRKPSDFKTNIPIQDNRTTFMQGQQDRNDLKPIGAATYSDDDLLARQRLAEEVVMLRSELSRLKNSSTTNEKPDLLLHLRSDISRLESEKEQAVAQANREKAMLELEIKQLTSEVKRGNDPKQGPQQLAGDFMERLRLRKEFEENFTRTLRDLRKELEQTGLKEVDKKNRFRVGVRNLIQISNERIDKVMEDAALIPVEERIHIETLRLLIENAKLRKLLNDYSEGILRNSLAKVDKRSQLVPAGLFPGFL